MIKKLKGGQKMRNNKKVNQIFSCILFLLLVFSIAMTIIQKDLSGLFPVTLSALGLGGTLTRLFFNGYIELGKKQLLEMTKDSQ